MAIIQAIIALVPLFKQLLDLFIKTPAEKQADFLKQLPAKLTELHNAFVEQTKNHNPADVNKQLNGG